MKLIATSASRGAASTQGTRLFRRALLKLSGPLVIGMVLAFAAPSAAVSAAGSGLEIELNKTEDAAAACIASFVVRNAMGHTLDRFSMDLYVFDGAGVIARQVLLDLAPLRDNKTTVARFNLIAGSCADVSRILVNDIPSCRAAGSGEDLDCLGGLAVSSRGKIEMVK